MFNPAIDSKLRGCDLVNLRVRDVTHGNQIVARAMIMQRKTQRSVQFELTDATGTAVAAWIEKAKLKPEQCPFPSRLVESPHLPTRQYARIVHHWVAAIGLGSTVYGTHTYDAADKSNIDLQTDERSTGRSASAWTHEAGKHRSISRHRSR